MKYIIVIFLLAPVLAFSQISFSNIASPKAKLIKPNIVMIMVDDMGYNDFERFATPAFDSLKNKGLHFKNFYVEPRCTPTRTALFTGDYPGVHGTAADADGMEKNTVYPDQTRYVDTSEVLISEAAKNAGYSTALLGKWHLGRPVTSRGPTQQGFDLWRGWDSNIDLWSHVTTDGDYRLMQYDSIWRDTGYLSHLTQSHAEEFISDNAAGPFLAFIHHFTPHFPVQGPDDSANREEGGGPYSLKSNSSPVDTSYKGMIQDIDSLLGRTYFFLDSMGLLNNTLLIFCSDNGGDIDDSWQSDSNTPHRGGKQSVYEGGIRSQALMIWEGVFSPKNITERIHIIDFFPFFLELMHESLSGYSYSGRPLLDLLLSGKPLSDPYVRCSQIDFKTVIAPNEKIYEDTGVQQLFYASSDTTFNENSDDKAVYTEEYKQLQRELSNWKNATGL